jgi:hypothetical protein
MRLSISFRENTGSLNTDVKTMLVKCSFSKLKQSENCNITITGFPALLKRHGQYVIREMKVLVEIE